MQAFEGANIDEILGRLATPPVPVMEAENALHAALLAVAENGEGLIELGPCSPFW